MILPSVDAIEAFVEAARFLNFRTAARAVSITPAALGKRIQQLEEQMGVKLFHRTTRQVELTEAGMALLPRAKQMLEVAEDCVRAAQGETGPPPMELRMGTRHELGLSWIIPMLPDLREEFPHVTFHLYFSSGPDLEHRVSRSMIDCAVSSRPLSDPKVDSARLHREDYVFVAAPSLLDEQPLDESEDAREHTLIDIGPDMPLFKYWRDAPDADPHLPFGQVLHMGTIAAIRHFIVAGDGVGVLPYYLVEPDLEAGRLQEVFPEVEADFDYFRLIFRGDDPRKSMLQRLAERMSQEPLQ